MDPKKQINNKKELKERIHASDIREKFKNQALIYREKHGATAMDVVVVKPYIMKISTHLPFN